MYKKIKKLNWKTEVVLEESLEKLWKSCRRDKKSLIIFIRNYRMKSKKMNTFNNAFGIFFVFNVLMGIKGNFMFNNISMLLFTFISAMALFDSKYVFDKTNR